MTGNATPRRFEWRSVRWRLPLQMAGLVFVVTAVLVWLSYLDVRRAQMQAAGARVQLAANQLSDTLRASMEQRLTEARRQLTLPAIIACLQSVSPEEACPELRERFKELPGPGWFSIDVWDLHGRRRFSVGSAPTPDGMLPPGPAPTHAGAGRLQLHAREVVVSEFVVDISAPANSDEAELAASSRSLGFIVVRRPLAAAPSRELLARLVGSGASIKLGNRDGDVWTDLATSVAAPAVDLTKPGIARYRSTAGEQYLGALALIGGTPWAVWIEFPEALVFAPARAFLGRTAILGLVFVALAAAVARALSAGISRPLVELTDVSEAIASGQYARRITSRRRDELGRLAVAFNVMAERIEQGHRTLEARVEERTAELQNTQAELDQFFQLSPEMLGIADLEGRFVQVNPAWQETLGWSPAELTSVPYLDFVHPDDRAATSEQATFLADGKALLSFRNRYRCADGSYRWLSWRAAANVQRGRIYAAARDVTDLINATDDARRHSEELTAVNQELEAFTYSVSHDLRAPLRHITGFAELLEQAEGASLAPESARLLQRITSAASRMGQLVDDLLAFSRVSRTPLTKSRVDLNKLLSEAKEEVLTGVDGRAIVWTQQPLPSVSCDRAMLRLVLLNLLANAIKYSSKRDRTCIEIGSRPGTPGETIVFIRDNGVGFDMRYVDKLFGVFQRLHRSEDFEGTGIGLANVRRIVQRHGGRTWAEGAVDHGATFYFSLPA